MVNGKADRMLSQTEMRKLHLEGNKVYYHPKIGLYTVTWIETGNNDIAVVEPIDPVDLFRTRN
jgi:hypothetical protein